MADETQNPQVDPASDPAYAEYLQWKGAQAEKTDPETVQITLRGVFVSYERNDTGGYTLRNYLKDNTEASIEVNVIDATTGTGDTVKVPAGNVPPEITAYHP